MKRKVMAIHASPSLPLVSAAITVSGDSELASYENYELFGASLA